MSNEGFFSDRRTFISKSLQAGAASIMAAAAVDGHAEIQEHAGGEATSARENLRSAARPLIQIHSLPSRVFIEHADGVYVPTDRTGTLFSSGKAEVRFEETAGETSVHVSCPQGAISRVIARWETRFPQDTLFLGDAWERSYGDLQWRFLQPERVMPWYFAAHQQGTGRTFMLGVKTQPSALCFWTIDGEGISLWLDLRNGGSPSVPGQREIPAATIVSLSAHEGETPFAGLRRFCRTLCPSPRLPPTPICGNNNWYYAYGVNFDANAIRRDAAFLAELAAGHRNLPYCVIDAGWTPGGVCPGGPWDRGDSKTFPDMPGLAADMRKLGVRPGIWMRPTALSTVDDARRLRSGPIAVPEKPLDLTLPENLAGIHDDVERVRSWGYELIKHDFSTYDIFGRWGKDMGAEITDPGWHFHDQTLTNAEIILSLYRTLRKAAGDGVLLGCNTMGHLGAGLFEAQRTGDDTSGHAWERTRRMGVNTLGYRLVQNGAFFACDPDCAAHTEKTPWDMDRQFLDVVARSGASLFVSVDPTKATPEQKKAFSSALQLALSGGSQGACEPVDWLGTTAPEVWQFGKDRVRYRWAEPYGTSPFPA